MLISEEISRIQVKYSCRDRSPCRLKHIHSRSELYSNVVLEFPSLVIDNPSHSHLLKLQLLAHLWIFQREEHSDFENYLLQLKSSKLYSVKCTRCCFRSRRLCQIAVMDAIKIGGREGISFLCSLLSLSTFQQNVSCFFLNSSVQQIKSNHF